jgi:RNA polymerase sigma factor (sigma-70 family)
VYIPPRAPRQQLVAELPPAVWGLTGGDLTFAGQFAFHRDMAAVLPPFQSLLDAHGREVHRFLVAGVGPVDADDLWQETWLSALRAYPALGSGEYLRAWVMTIAHRKVIDHARGRARRPVPVAATEPWEIPDGAVAADRIAPASETDRLIARLAAEPLWDHVAALPDKQRTALTLRYVADLSHAEIAAVMEISEEAARRNVHEALTRLREKEDLR